jgi:transposase-like protein
MKKYKRSYSEEEKASALALLKANRGNVTKTSSDLNVPATTLRQWRDGEHVNADVAKKREKKERSLAELFEEVAYAYLDRALETEAVSESKGKEAVVAAATALDKLRLLQGEATSISEVRDDSGARDILAERLIRLRAASELN